MSTERITSPVLKAHLPKEVIHKPCLVLWEDASSVHEDTGWHNIGEIKYYPRVVSQLGFIMKETEDVLFISEAILDSQCGPVTQIPMGMVRKIIVLA